jgi:hypothetical protein
MNEQEAQLQTSHGEQERRLRTIVGDLFQHSERLVKAELALGIDEIHQRVEAGKAALQRAVIVTGLFYASYLALLAALVLGLSTVLPAWVAALIVGFVSGGAGYVLAREKEPDQERAHNAIDQLPHNVASRAH